MRDLWIMVDAAVRFVAAMAVAALPRCYWRSLDAFVPVSRAALPSAIATILVAFAVAIPAFWQFTEANANQAVELMLRATGWRRSPPGAEAPPEAVALGTWFAGFASPLQFALLTPLGLFCTYLLATGYFRAVSAYVDDARGDPVVTAVDAFARRMWSSARARRAVRERERLEGPEVPDRLVPGRAAGCPDADLVVVASRRKAGWERGTFVITSEKWYRLGTPVDRQMPGGLRTLYPLTEITDHEVLRRGVPYELPPLSGSPSIVPR
ncbi:MAG: hypothetical protein HY657_18400 [Acidobacteria bacterium]|nr:hypothetical protein [Acidobacteriota bacterium]